MAHNILSPGISVQVIDQTAYAAATAGTVAAAVGFAEKGPIDEPTLILSKEEYQNTFGNPIVDNYYFGLFADKFLDYSVGYFTRIAKEVDYEAVIGTVAPALDFIGITNPEFFIDLAGFPSPNNGIYRVAWTGGTPYTDLAALITAINTAFGTVTLADGSTTLDDYLTAQANATFLEFSADIYRNVVITIKASGATDNVAKISGAGHIGMAGETASTDVGSFAYSYIRVPVNEVAATAASITGTAAMVATDLNQLSAFNKINLSVDATSSNPYKTYEDINITPATGLPGTPPAMLAESDATYPLTLTAGTFDVTLNGYYHFQGLDATGDVNKVHSITVSLGPHADIAALVIALNTALAAVVINAGTLEDYIKFATDGTVGFLTTAIGAVATLKNYGSQCGTRIASTGTADATELGYSVDPFPGAATWSPGGDATYTTEGVATKINAAVAEATVVSAIDIITITSARTGTTSYVEINTATTVADDALALVHFIDSNSDTGINRTNVGAINFVYKYAGTAGDNIKVRTYSSTNPVTAVTEYYIEVFNGDDSMEVWGPVDWIDNTATNFVATVLETSDYIRMDFGETIEYPNTDTDSPPTSVPPNNADVGEPEYWLLAGGDDGIPSISTESDALAILALDEYNNKEQYIIDLLLAPGFTGSAVVSKLQSVGEARQDILAIVDPPPFLTYIEAIAWHNGSYTNGGGSSTSLTSSHIVFSWGWQRDFDAYNEQYVDLPPSIYEAVAIAKTQQNFELWEAPAGTTRGIVNSISSYTKPTAAQREYLYNDVDPACVNPIVQFPTEGILIYGQKTCLKQNKATNRINVRRLVNNVVRNIESIGRGYIFDLNNASTWASITREINSFLSNIQERGGLQSFGVYFDASTNTAAKTDQGIMYGKVFIQPTRVAERIFIDLTIQRTGALAAEV